MLRSLQVGRALAAIAVSAYHLSFAFTDPRIASQPVFAQITGKGYLGVDFFFVLSGFIIFFVHEPDIGNPGYVTSYAAKRVIRVYPIYWLLTALAVAATTMIGGVKPIPQSPADLASTVLLFRFNTFDTPISAAWTLFHEVLFYVVFGLLIVNRRLGMAVMIAWLSLLLVTFRYGPFGDWSFWWTLASANNLSFFCGMIAFLLARRMTRGRGTVLVLIGAAMLIALHPVDLALDTTGLARFAYSIAFMLIIAGAVAVERSGLSLRLRPLGLIGDASYSLYLTHESVESVLLKIARRTQLLDRVDHHVLYVVILAITVAAGVVVYRVIEAPLLAAIRRLTVRITSRRASGPEAEFA